MTNAWIQGHLDEARIWQVVKVAGIRQVAGDGSFARTPMRKHRRFRYGACPSFWPAHAPVCAGFFAHKERTFVMKVRVFWSFCHILQFLTNYRISYNYLTSMSNGVNKGRKIFQGCFSGQLACFFKKIQWIEKRAFSRLLVHTFFHVCEYIVGEIFLRGDCVVQKRVDV
mgnify:FL=1